MGPIGQPDKKNHQRDAAFPRCGDLQNLYIISKRKTGRISRLQTRGFTKCAGLPSLELTYILRKVLLSRWFSLSKCGICDRSLEGTHYFKSSVMLIEATFLLNFGNASGLWA